MSDVFIDALPVADAVLFEGYLLYPYRSSSQKNQLRWQFGVLMPPAYAAEPSASQTECLVEPGAGAPTLQVLLRCLQLLPGGEAEIREFEAIAALGADEQEFPVSFAASTSSANRPSSPSETHEPAVPSGNDSLPSLTGQLRVSAERCADPYGLLKVRIRVANTSPCDSQSRDAALKHALVSTHLLLAVTGGSFISLIDPPEWATPAAHACHNEGTWPVLVGTPGQQQLMLSAPIILYDYPQVAPESPGDLFDATEIDEILTLRTLALTDDEKQEARQTDPRAAAIVDRVEAMPREILERLHGAIRYVRNVEQPQKAEHVPWWDPGADTSVSPETDTLTVQGAELKKGSHVRLQPGTRRADAQDMFLAGRTARVEGVFTDVDEQRYLAVTLDDDPAADLYQSHGRFLYFHPDEVEPL